VIFINQIRMKIGVMFGSPETTTGGNALKFYSSVRLDIRRIGALKKDEDVIGNRTRVKVVKNKMAPPFKEVEFDILYGHGVSREGDLVDLASEANIIDKSGAWFSFGGERIGQGRENAKQFLIDHPETYNSIEAKVLAHYGVRRIGIDVAPEAVADSPVKAEGSGKIEAHGSASASSKVDPKGDHTHAKSDSRETAKAETRGGATPVAAPHNGKRPNA
jgi:recombination protein RecA